MTHHAHLDNTQGRNGPVPVAQVPYRRPMTPRPRIAGDPALIFDYLVSRSTAPDSVYEDITAETLDRFPDLASMQISPDQFTFLNVMARMTNAHLAVEVGTFTGSSSVAIATGLAPGGRLICCDVSDEFTSVARRFWTASGLGETVELRLGPALDTLTSLDTDNQIDLAFIDADKSGYIGYYEALMERMRPGGVVIADNVLWSGRVADRSDTEASTEAIRAFNDHVQADHRVVNVMINIGDGLMVCVRR